MSGYSENYVKIVRVIQTCLPPMMRELLSVEEPSHLIDGHAKNNHNFYNKLRVDEQKLISDATAKGYNNFDIPLMYKIFRNLSKVATPTRGWSSPIDPNQNETTIGDDIERIRRIRNSIVHQGNTNVTEVELKNYIVLLKGIAKRFETYLKKSSGHFVKEFEGLENHNHTEAQINEIIQDIKFIKEKEKTLTKKMKKLKQNVDGFITTDAIDVLLDERWEIETRYIETDIVKEVLDKLKSNNIVTVTGISGIGKSATIYHIAFDLRKLEGYKIVPCYTPGEILSHFRKGSKTIFVIDDVCGKYEVLKSAIDIWIQYETKVQSILRINENKLIASCRLQVFNDDHFKRLKLFTACSVELLRYTRIQKNLITQEYLSSDDIKSIEGVIDKCDFFPLMCSLYNAKLHTDAPEFFRNTFDIYQEEFDKIRDQDDKSKYFALTLVVLCNGELTIVESRSFNERHINIQDEKMLQNLFKSYNISNETSAINILKHLDAFVGTFLKRQSNDNEFGLLKTKLTYKPFHDKIFDYLAFHCGCNFQAQLIKHADSSIINQRTQLRCLSAEVEDQTIIQIENKHEEIFFTRVMQDMLEGKSEDVFNSRQMRHKVYRSKFILYMYSNKTIIRKMFKGDFGKNILINICSSGYWDLLDCMFKIMRSVSALVKPLSSCKQSSRMYTLIGKLKHFNSSYIKLRIHDTEHSYTSLVVASYYGYTNLAELLITNGAKVNCVASHGGITPLIAALTGKHKIVFELLIKKGALKNICDKKKCSPLMWACRLGLHSEIEILLDTESSDSDTIQQQTTALIDQTDIRGQTALMYACRYGHLDIAHRLVQKGADIRKSSMKHWTALMAGCRGGHPNIVTFLLDNNAKINEQDKSGMTPLLLACKQKSEHVVHLLINRGADINLPDKHGVTPKSIMDQNQWILAKDKIKGQTKTTYDLQCSSDIEALQLTEEITIQNEKITSL